MEAQTLSAARFSLQSQLEHDYHPLVPYLSQDDPERVALRRDVVQASLALAIFIASITSMLC